VKPARELDLDYTERAGFLTGKSAKLADWHFKKEQAEFTRQVAVLRAKKWAAENPEKRRENANRYASKPEARARSLALAKARRREKVDPTVHTCAECGVQWCRMPGTRGRAGAGKFCRNASYARPSYQEKTPGARRVKRRS
jgi:hypothetical protein